MHDLLKFPWDETVNRYFTYYGDTFSACRQALPEGMKIIGGIGYGIFESVQDFIPLTNLAYLEIDEPEVFELIWEYVGSLFIKLWKRLLDAYGDIIAVCRMGDDLGFKTSLLIKPDTFNDFIKPQYKAMVELIHGYGKPFLLHSCGCIWSIMEALINEVHIDAKHSNEDEIAPFDTWVKRYGGQIALFGGIDVNVLCLKNEGEIKEYIINLLNLSTAVSKSIAIGSGNQITEYVPTSGYITMVETVRRWRNA